VSQSQYATAADIQKLAITPAAYARFEGASAGCVVAALQAASSIADTYLPSQFTLPLQVSPQGWDMSLTMNVCWIAAWLLYNSFGFAPMAPGDDLVVKRYESALAWLGQIRDKEIFPQYVDAINGATTSPEQGPFVISDPPVGFTNRGLAPGQVVCNPWGWWN
jgi:phage gp36-like protein